MHKHHATLRLLIILVSLVLVGAAIYALLAYGSEHPASAPTASTTGIYFPVAGVNGNAVATTTLPVASTTSSGTASTSWEQGMTVVTNADNNGTVQLAKNERFVIQLGNNLKWNLTFDPATGITRVPNSTTADGVQGVYEADEVGTTTLHATGAPICVQHEACPDFMLEMTVTFIIK